MDSTRAHSGSRSVKATTDGKADYRQAYMGIKTPFFPVAGNAFYGRVWFYLAKAPTTSAHWTNISGEGNAISNATPFYAYVRYGGQTMELMANYDSSVLKSDCWQHPNSQNLPFPEARWTCFEWHFDGPNNKMELWVDGTAEPELTVVDKGQGCVNHELSDEWVFPKFELLRLGWEHYQTSIPVELWMDDVALDTKRIGCQ